MLKGSLKYLEYSGMLSSRKLRAHQVVLVEQISCWFDDFKCILRNGRETGTLYENLLSMQQICLRN